MQVILVGPKLEGPESMCQHGRLILCSLLFCWQGTSYSAGICYLFDTPRHGGVMYCKICSLAK